MVSYGEVRKWTSGPLDAAEQRLKGLAEKLLGLSDDLADMGTPAGWEGDAAAAAQTRRSKIVDRMEQIVAEVAAARTGLMDASDGIVGLGHAVQDTEYLARAHQFDISDDGAVHDRAARVECPTEAEAQIQRERDRVQVELVDRVEQLMRRATDIDNDLVALLGKISRDEIDTQGVTSLASAAKTGADQGQLSVLEPPKGNATPGDNAGWWASLSPAEKRQVIEDHPEWVGNRDGIPAVDRDQANRAILAGEKERLLAEERRLQADIDDNLFGELFAGDTDDRLEEVRDKLKGITAIEKKLDGSSDLPDDQRHYLLGFSSDGDGRAIVAKGNPDTADNVATYIPGTGADLPGMNDLMNRSDKMWLAAENAAGNETTSVITWLGYDAPDGLHNATSGDYAQDARASLDGFQDGLRTTHEGSPSHNTVIGHSYGSTVIGHSARDMGLDVDKMVFVGSPGVGVDHASALNIDPDNVYATTAREDIIHEVPEFIHGNHPIDDDFGAHEFESDPGKGDWIWENVETHSKYWDDGNKSLRNMGQLIVDNPGKVPEVR